MNSNGQIVLITGGTGDLGRAMVEKFWELGAKVYFTYKNREVDAASMSRLDEDKIIPVCVDVDDYNDVIGTIDEILLKETSIDVLINNAGMNDDKLFALMSPQSWHKVITTNLDGTFNCCKAAIKKMINKRKGSIINIASVSGIIGIAGQCNYAASKAGIIGMTKALSKEVGAYGIRVNCVAPGFIESKMTEKIPKEMMDKYIEQIPLRRMGRVDEVANVVAFLACEQASYLSGNTITIDGGMSS